MSTATNGYHNDPEDMFHHTRMSLGDHIEELRRHMLKAVAGFLVAMCVGLYFGDNLMIVIARPVTKELKEMRKRQLMKRQNAFREGKNDMRPDWRPMTIYVPRQLGEKLPGAEELTPIEKENPPTKADIEAKALTKKELETKQGESSSGWEGLWDWMTRKTPEPGAPEEEKADVMRLKVLVNGNETAIAAAGGQEIVDPASLSSLTATESFTVWMKVSVYFGIVLASPWIFYQLWMFVAAGLYPSEKKYVNVYLPFSLGLFLCGVALCEFLVMPIGLHWLLKFNESMNVEPNLRLSDWLSFAIMMPLIFGAAFQTPLVMFFLERLGIVDAAFYRKHRRIAIFVLALAAALLAVSPDPLSMMAMAIPMWILYELGIKLCDYMPKEKLDLDVPESEEMIEV